MFRDPSNKGNPRYSRIGNTGETGEAICLSWRTPLMNGHLKFSSIGMIILSLAILSVVGGAGFLAGKSSSENKIQTTIELDTISQVFRYNRTFGEAPSTRTDKAWDDLFPAQGGFFKHPTIAPKRSAFSVFHQLHCLNGIRIGYWAAHDAAIEGRKITDEDMPMMSSPAHIRHCIDLLRHSLMCQPDTTVEVKDEAIGGVKGFGTEHRCKDWDRLMEWTTEWQNYNHSKSQ